MECTLGLKDNPFDPKHLELGRLAGAPLAVHLHPDLGPLVCWQIGGLEQLYDDLRKEIFEEAEVTNAVNRDMIVLLVGARGSGRTTLACHVRSNFSDGKKPGGVIWHHHELIFSPHQQYSIDEVKAQFAALETHFADKFGDRSGHVLLTVENLPVSHFNRVMVTFDKFPALRRLFIVTSDEEALLARDLDSAGPYIYKAEVKKLSAGDVRALINQRVALYRDARMPSPMPDEDLALFPFALSAPSTVVGDAGKPLRAVISSLLRRVDSRHHELAKRQGLVAAAQAAPDDLRSRLIA